MTYGIDVRNEGPDIARWVSVSLALSTSLELRSVQTGPHRDPTRSTGCLLGGSLRRPLAHCTFDAVGSGGAFTLTVVAVSRTPGRVVAMAAVDSATRDPAKDDNSASAVTTVVTG
jgi:hypothetical protein